MDAERLEWLRYLASGGGGDFTEEHCDLASDCLREICRLASRAATLEALVGERCAENERILAEAERLGLEYKRVQAERDALRARVANEERARKLEHEAHMGAVAGYCEQGAGALPR